MNGMAALLERIMNKIGKLTQEQMAKFPEYVERWKRIGLSTEPANRAEAERGVRLAYELAGLKLPRIVWCSSPLAQGITRMVVIEYGKEIGASVRASVRASVWNSVGASVRESVGESVLESGYGQHDADWLAPYAYFYEQCGLREQTRKLDGLRLICENAGWFLPHANICWISERHNVCNLNARGRIHCDDGPAIAYPDGWSIYALDGMRVPEQVVMRPAEITVQQIHSEKNAEVRRVMIARYAGAKDPKDGLAKYMLDAGAKTIHARGDYALRAPFRTNGMAAGMLTYGSER